MLQFASAAIAPLPLSSVDCPFVVVEDGDFPLILRPSKSTFSSFGDMLACPFLFLFLSFIFYSCSLLSWSLLWNLLMGICNLSSIHVLLYLDLLFMFSFILIFVMEFTYGNLSFIFYSCSLLSWSLLWNLLMGICHLSSIHVLFYVNLLFMFSFILIFYSCSLLC